MTDTTKFLDCQWEFPPFRTLCDYLMDSSRFQLPNHKDLRKWNNRVINNLVYYQTNYLYTCIAIVLVMLSLNPVKMLIGMATLLSICGMFFYYFEIDEFCIKLKRNFPQIGVIYVIMCGSTVFYTRNSVIYALFSILLSFCVIFIHASLRLRNMKNKLANKVEGMGLKHTPMGIMLNYFGMKEEGMKEMIS